MNENVQIDGVPVGCFAFDDRLRNFWASSMTPEKFKDMYAMLLKLDELKKKEIITDAEFQLQKKKLLGEEKAP